MHIFEYLQDPVLEKSPNALVGPTISLEGAPSNLDFTGIEYIRGLQLAGYDYDINLPHVYKIEHLDLQGYSKKFNAKTLNKVGSLNLNNSQVKLNLPSCMGAFYMSMLNYKQQIYAPNFKKVVHLQFNSKTQRQFASGRSIFDLESFGTLGQEVQYKAAPGVYYINKIPHFMEGNAAGQMMHLDRNIFMLIESKNLPRGMIHTIEKFLMILGRDKFLTTFSMRGLDHQFELYKQKQRQIKGR